MVVGAPCVMYRMKTHSMLSLDCVANLDLLLRGRQLSFKLHILFPERGHRLFELIARLLHRCNVLPGFLVGALKTAMSSENKDKD